MNYPKPKLLVSSCLEFEKVRYDGKVIPCKTVRDLEPYVEYVKVCPEYAIGLGVPRQAIRIVKKGDDYRLIQHKTDLDLTDKMNEFSNDFISKLPELDGFIFKSKSPTMGLSAKVYSGMKGAPVISRCGGFFAGKIAEKYNAYPIEEENRLKNKKIRDHFLITIFAYAGFRTDPNFKEKNKLLMKYYSDEEFKDLSSLSRIFKRPPDSKRVYTFYQDIISLINNSEEFKRLLDEYMKNKVSEETIKEVFKVSLKSKDLLKQTFFNPYPTELKSEIDEDRKRNFWK
jgi:uncharacterized protein YbbK (DUF523 family)